MITSFRQVFCPSRESVLESTQCVFNSAVRREEKRSCDTCRCKTEEFYDERDGSIHTCDFFEIDIVNGHPLTEDVEQCDYWERDPGVYDFYKETVNED